MKNKILISFIFVFLNTYLLAENIKIESKVISIDKKKEISIFKDEVKIITEDGYNLFSDYAEYDKKNKIIKLKKNVIATDNKKNKILTNYAEYNESNGVFKSKGDTEFISSENYTIKGTDINFDYKNKIISSEYNTLISDIDNNQIQLANFRYETSNSIFKSIGSIEIKDKLENTYKFSQIYIDTKKKEVFGTDAKTFLNHKGFKIKEDNKPRIFSNSIKLNKNSSSFEKSVFTICDYRKKDKCPPWTIQSSKMLHNRNKKTIYYDNAILKIFDVPVFYFPKLSHPDPTVDRRSGFLVPSFSNSKNLGSSLSIPYYLTLDDNKDFTLTNKLFISENPLFQGEYRHAFKNSNLLLDFGFTEGYKKTSVKKKSGQKSHLFSQFFKNYIGKNGSKNTIKFKTEDVSNDKYLKLYDIKTDIVDKDKDFLENSFSYTHENEDLYFGLDAYMYETLKTSYNDKYEFILPEINLDKNLFSNNSFGSLDLQTSFKSHTFDTNKTSNFLINNFNWDIKNSIFNNGIKGKLFSNLKNINYETKNIDKFKSSTTSELFGSIGYLTELDLIKETDGLATHIITPKIFLRYAPDHMRKEASDDRLNALNLYDLNRLNNEKNFEGGLSSAFGFDYQMNKSDKKLNLSIGQVLSAKENKNMPSSSSLDEKLSDIVGTSSFSMNDKVSLDYNFAIDQNYNDINYQEAGVNLDFNVLKFDINYLQEKKHIGDEEYLKTSINYFANKNNKFTLESKRSLVTNSSEFYDLSYEYINDCLKAGLVYRREFYNDSELESENSLMFKITLIPFGDINSPSINK